MFIPLIMHVSLSILRLHWMFPDDDNNNNDDEDDADAEDVDHAEF